MTDIEGAYLRALRVEVVITHSSYIETINEFLLHLGHRVDLRHEIQGVLQRQVNKFILPPNADQEI